MNQPARKARGPERAPIVGATTGRDRIRRFARYETVPPDLLNAVRFMEAARITVGEFRALVQVHHLVPVARTNDGRTLYSRADVERVILMKTNEGRLPRRRGWQPDTYSKAESDLVMRRLAAGETLDAISLTTDIHPVKLRTIRETYLEFSGAIILKKDVIDRLQGVSVSGASYPLKTGEDVLDLLRLAVKEQACASCGTKKRSPCCTRCTHAIVEHARKKDGREQADDEPLATGTD